MAFFYTGPRWFFGYDIALELLFGIVTALIAIYSFKVYRLSCEKECRLLGWAFAGISIAYFLWPLVNFIAFLEVQKGIAEFDIGFVSSAFLVSTYAHVVFFLLGLTTLAYLTLRLKNQRAYTLLVSLSILVVIFSSQPWLAFNFVAAVLLLYVSIYYMKRYKASKDGGTLVVFISFMLLFLARIVLVFANINNSLYVVDHIIELFAYVLLAVSLAQSIRKK